MDHRLEQALSVARRIPFTLGVVATMLVVGIVTTTLWSPLLDKSWYESVAYGLPSFEAGRWWTPATGSIYALVPAQYLPIAGGFLLMVGFSELRLGTRVTAMVTIVCQLAGVLGAALFLLLVRDTGWEWAARTSETIDVGFSAGAVGALVCAAATLRRPWRGRVRALITVYVVASFVYIGVLWDLEHLIAFAVAVPWGTRLAGRPLRFTPKPVGRHEARLLAATLFWVSAAVTLAGAFVSSDGPFGRFGDPGESRWYVLFAVLFDVLIGFGLRGGRRLWWRVALTLTLIPVALAGLGVVVVVVVTLVTGDPGRVWSELGADGSLGEAAVVVLFDAVQLTVLWFWRRAFLNPGRRARAKGGRETIGALTADSDVEAARHDLRAAGSPNNLSWMTTWPENRWYFSSSGAGYQAYRLHAGVAIALADPVGTTPERRAEVLTGFVDAVTDAGIQPCVFSATREAADVLTGRGWARLQVAEEAVIDLPTLEFRGKKWQDVRTALNQGRKLGIEFRMTTLAEAPRGQQVQVRAISEEWVGDKGLPEMGFTLGGVDEAMDPEVLVGLAVDADGTVHGVTSWMPIHGPGGTLEGYTLDVMRRLPDGFRYTMEFLIASSCSHFKELGLDRVSLSGAPLAGGGGDDEGGLDRTSIDVVLDRISTLLEPYYGFRSLHLFKEKFQPRHVPLYMLVPDEGSLPRASVAIGRAYIPDAGPAELVAMARSGH
jgi:phosphatidylglycerol lysyltransferase